MRGVLTRLLILLVLPVLIVTMPGTADAATKYGDANTFPIEWEGWLPGDSGHCDVQGNWVKINTSSLQVEVDATCSHGWNGEAGHVNATAEGTGAGGQACEAVFSFDVAEATAVVDTQTVSATRSDCHITDVCWEVIRDHGIAGSDEDEACVAWDLGDPLDTLDQTGCPDLEGISGADWTFATYPAQPTVYRYIDVKVTVGAVGLNGASTRILLWKTQSGALGTNSSLHTFTPTGPRDYTFRIGPIDIAAVPKGIQVDVTGPSTQSPPPGWNSGNPVLSDQLRLAASPDHYMGGMNWPARCTFYAGEKIADHPSSDHDEPAFPAGGDPSGGTTTPPADPPPATQSGCDFSVTDAATWLEGGMCAVASGLGNIAGLLKRLLDALLGLAQAILDGLAGLFIPSDGFLDSAFDDLQGDFEDSNAGDWQDEYSDGWESSTAGGSGAVIAVGGFSSGSGCSGPSVNWDGFSKVGMSSSWQPLSACGGITAQLASWTKVLLAAGLGIAGALKILSMVMVSLGMQKNPGVEPGGGVKAA